MSIPLAVPSKSEIPSSHAVSRSQELLSCCNSALKIAKQQHSEPDPDAWWSIPLSSLRLHDASVPSPVDHTLEEALALLRTMESDLGRLEGLVRRRGQTNDPTEEISYVVRQLQQDTQDLTNLVDTLVPSTARGQRKLHWEKVQEWFQTATSGQANRLKDILKTRAQVLQEQATRRKQFSSTRPTQLESPLFQIPNTKKKPATHNNNNNNIQSVHQTHSAPPFQTNDPYNYYRANYGGYGAAATSETGMRQRRPTTTTTTQQVDEQEHLLVQQQERQTQRRLQEAQYAERTLAELGTMFSKMTNLITQQSELVDKIEDDVEAAHADVTAGQEEITILYHLKKGNRPLILKVFGLLIFFIVFMRLYKK